MDIISYILSKKYTDKSLVGAGALKGANCTIQSIEPISGGHRITFKWILNDDTVETDTMDVMDGNDGLGIKSIDINSSNHLIVTYDDNTTHDAGLIEDSGSTVTYTQTLQSGTKIGEITIDGTTTNILAPSGGSGAEKEIVHVTQLPDGTEIEDKIYELLGGIDTRSDVIEFPNSSQDIRSIEEYFNDRGYFEKEEDENLVWNVNWFPYYVETFVKDNKTYVLEQIFYLTDTQVYGIRYSDDTDQYWMEVQPSTTLTTQVKITHVEYFIGDSNTHNLVWIKDANYFAQDINSLRVENLLNVNITDSLQDNSVLAYDSATNRWKNSSAFATKSEVQAKQDVVQYSELPTPSASLEGKVLQYIGDGTPSKAVVTVIDDGGNKSSTTTGILSYLQNKHIPLNIGVNTYQIGSSNKYYSLAELHTLEEQGSEIIMRGGTDSSFSTDAATVEAFTQDAEAVKTYAETNGFNTKLRIYPQGIRVYGGPDVDEKIGVLNDLGVEMAFNLECNVEMYDMSHSHPGYEEWYDYANGHDAGLGIANVAPFVTMPNGYSKGLMLNRAEMTHAKLKDTQRVADINTMIQAHRYVVLFGHSYQSEWTTAGDDGKTTTELFESFIDDLTETYGDEILWLTPTQAWNYFNSLPKTGHFYKCVAENNTYTWQEIPSVSEVTVTPTLSTGTKIGSISVDGTSTDLFAPSGSGGATSLSGLSDVQLSQSIGNGQALRYDSTSGKWINVPITPPVESSQLTEITLEPNRFYILSGATELDISLNVSSSLLFIQEFDFMFLSGSTPTELSLPSDVIVPDDFSIEANKIYEISIMNGLMLYNSWTPSTEEEPEEP